MFAFCMFGLPSAYDPFTTAVRVRSSDRARDLGLCPIHSAGNQSACRHFHQVVKRWYIVENDVEIAERMWTFLGMSEQNK